MLSRNGSGMAADTGVSIERFRKTLGLDRTQLGKCLGVSPMTVSLWERGADSPPAGALLRMAKLATTKTDHWLFLGLAGFSGA